jgi:hypothetical protein
MIMKKSSVFSFGLAAIVLASAASTFGQEKPATFEKEVAVQTGVAFQGPEGAGSGGNTFTFVNSEFSFDKLVKGAPYSAQAVTEMTQILSDGNRIVNTSSAAVYRDGEGRTRREQTLKAIGNFSAHGEPFQTISVNDPVAGVAYVLEPHSHTARKIGGFRLESGTGAGFKIRSPGGEGEAFTFNTATSGPVTINRGTAEAKMIEEKERTGVRKEHLGMQTVEGVNAVGTRTTITIPAGQIGNERAIEIVEERWYSPELQTMVMTRHSDPRSGETVYRLTNINRTEPDHSLFEVPVDYKLSDDSENLRFRFEKPAKPDQQW